MATTNTWDQVVSKITGVANRGTLNWSGSNTTYVLSSGYYTGGTLDSRPSYNNGYNTGVSAADNRVNTSSASYSSGYNNGYSAGNTAGYNNGYNAGVNAGKQTMGSTLQYVHSVSMGQNDPYYGSYTAASAGYYLVIACAAGTGDGNKKRTITISTTGTSRSYVRYWISKNGYSTTQTGCRQAVGVMICYMNSGNKVSYMLDTDYNTTEFCIIFKLG